MLILRTEPAVAKEGTFPDTELVMASLRNAVPWPTGCVPYHDKAYGSRAVLEPGLTPRFLKAWDNASLLWTALVPFPCVKHTSSRYVTWDRYRRGDAAVAEREIAKLLIIIL